ncbi:thymidylate synthase thyX [Mycobacterium tuberculosis T17]|nr:thymidylate synthase thyX [Mycobacterium tuberculosis T17]
MVVTTGAIRLTARSMSAPDSENGGELLASLEAKFTDQSSAILRRRPARPSSRAVLPSATETRIVVTGNYRAWRSSSQCGPASTTTRKSG